MALRRNSPKPVRLSVAVLKSRLLRPASATVPPLINEVTSPTAVTSTGGTVATASFTPTANALLVAVSTVGNTFGSGVNTAAVTDSLGSTWTMLRRSNGTNGSAEIWALDAGASPTARTITVTGAGTNAVGVSLCVKVLTGAKPVAGQTGATAIIASGTARQIAITTTTADSIAVGGYVDVVASGALTVNSITTAWQTVSDVTNTEKYAAFRATDPTVTPGAVTIGFSTAAGGNGPKVAVEILAATGTNVNDDAEQTSHAVAAGDPAPDFDITDTTAPSNAHTTTDTVFGLGVPAADASTAHTTADVTATQTTTDTTAPANTHTTNDTAPALAVNAADASTTHQTFDATTSSAALVNATAELTNHAVTTGDPTGALATNADLANHSQIASDASPALAVPAGQGATTHTTNDPLTSITATDGTAPANAHTTNPTTPTLAVNAGDAATTHQALDPTISTAVILNVNAVDATTTHTTNDATAKQDINPGAAATTHQTFDAIASTTATVTDTNPATTHTTNPTTPGVGAAPQTALHSFQTPDPTPTLATLAELATIAHSTYDAIVTTSIQPPAFVAVDTALTWTNSLDNPYATRASADSATTPGTRREGSAYAPTPEGTSATTGLVG